MTNTKSRCQKKLAPFSNRTVKIHSSLRHLGKIHPRDPFAKNPRARDNDAFHGCVGNHNARARLLSPRGYFCGVEHYCGERDREWESLNSRPKNEAFVSRCSKIDADSLHFVARMLG